MLKISVHDDRIRWDIRGIFDGAAARIVMGLDDYARERAIEECGSYQCRRIAAHVLPSLARIEAAALDAVPQYLEREMKL